MGFTELSNKEGFFTEGLAASEVVFEESPNIVGLLEALATLEVATFGGPLNKENPGAAAVVDVFGVSPNKVGLEKALGAAGLEAGPEDAGALFCDNASVGEVDEAVGLKANMLAPVVVPNPEDPKVGEADNIPREGDDWLPPDGTGDAALSSVFFLISLAVAENMLGLEPEIDWLFAGAKREPPKELAGGAMDDLENREPVVVADDAVVEGPLEAANIEAPVLGAVVDGAFAANKGLLEAEAADGAFVVAKRDPPAVGAVVEEGANKDAAGVDAVVVGGLGAKREAPLVDAKALDAEAVAAEAGALPEDEAVASVDCPSGFVALPNNAIPPGVDDAASRGENWDFDACEVGAKEGKDLL